MNPITLAVISDLHIGYARAKDLWPEHERTQQQQQEFDKLVDADYKETFLKFLRDNNISADYLVVPGDISDKGQHAQLHLASSLISEVANTLNVQAENVLYVPGNHDSDWIMMDRIDPTSFYHSIRFISLRDKDLIFEQIVQRGEGHVLDEPCFSLWEYPDLIAIGYNSSWEDTPQERPHYGAIPEDHLQELELRLSNIDLSPSRLRLFIVHHHPFHYTDPDPDYQDFSVMRNAEGLMNLLRSHNFDLIIHGHKHWPKFAVDNTNLISPVAILCAGSFSAQIYAGWEGKVNNQFHLVQVEGRDKDKNNIYGQILSWTYLAAHGWLPSEKHNGIVHRNPFGSYYQASEVEKTLRPILEGKFAMGKFVRWSEVKQEVPHLAHLHPDLYEHVLKRLSQEMRFVCHPISDDIIFLME